MSIEKRKPTHVLIVDDEKSICDILSQYLQRVGYTTSIARSGEDALQTVRSSQPDLVLTDIKMPGMNGVDLLKTIKEINRSIPVLLTTGFPTLDTAIEALKLGAFDYLTKPFHLEEIGEKIRRALLSRRLEEENLLFSKLVSLHEVTKVITSTHELDALHREILSYCAQLSRADAGTLMFLDENETLTPQETTGEMVGREFWALPFFTQVATIAVSGTGALLYPGPLWDRQQMPEVPSGIDSCIIFPLRTSKRVLGVLVLVRGNQQGCFSDLDLQIVNVLASQASISIENARLYQNIRDNYLKTIRGFALAVEAKDRYTHGHSENVMKYTVVLAHTLGLSGPEIEEVKYAGLLHDIGKIGVSETILNKPSRLTDLEFEEIKKHPELGARIISDVPFLRGLVPFILHHHEFFDGSGYPGAIAGEEIPLGARILGVCDAFEAMTSDRPYRKALSIRVALDNLLANKGRQFDPHVLDAFVEMIKAHNRQ